MNPLTEEGDVTGTPGALMRSEIMEQPAAWLRLVDSQRSAFEEARALITAGSTDTIVFVARGSSDHAAMYGQYLAQVVLGVPTFLATPSVSSVFERNVYSSRHLVIGVSQSGASPDLVSTLESARGAGARIIALTNDPGSPMGKLADVHIDLSAGPELSVAATKTYTAEILALYLLVKLTGGRSYDGLLADVRALAIQGEQVIARSVDAAASFANEFVSSDRVMVVGRGYSMSTAKEAALKLMETCSVAASGWSAADAKHGPLGQAVEGTPVFCLTSSSQGRESVLALIPDFEAKGARVFVLGSGEPATNATHPFANVLPADIKDDTAPLLEIIPFQLLALELSALLGRDPDRPAGLSKVTLTT